MRGIVLARKTNDDATPRLAETAIFAQWFHSDKTLYYARWDDGEVDIVFLGPKQKAEWAVEVKWSDHYGDSPKQIKSLISFCRRNRLADILVTSRTKTHTCKLDGITIPFIPASVYCYSVGHKIVHARKNLNVGSATLGAA